MRKNVAIAFSLTLVVSMVLLLAVLVFRAWLPPDSREARPDARPGTPGAEVSRDRGSEPVSAAASREVAPTPDPAGHGGPWSVVGRVLRADGATPGTVNPVPDAAVRIVVLEDDNGTVDRKREGRETSTGGDGRFELEGVLAETPQRLIIDAPPSALVVTDFTLPYARAERRDLGDFLLEPAASLAVWLIGPRDEAIDGATVRGWVSSAGFLEAEGLGDGEYRFDRLPPGTTYMNVLARGYDCFLVIHDAVDLPREAPLVYRLREGNRAGGVIRDAEGRPVAAARVEIQTAGACAPPPLWTDLSGRFLFDSLMEGEAYSLSIRAPGFAPVDNHVVHLNTEDDEITLSGGAVLSGQVIAADDQSPVAGASVRLWRLSKEFRQRTDARGMFELRDVPLGSVGLLVEHDDFLPYRSETPVELPAGARSSGHSIRLERGCPATVEVIDSSSRDPVAGAEVTLKLPESDEDEGLRRSGTTGPDGRWTLRGVHPGTATLTVSAKGFFPGERPFPITADGSAAIVVPIDPAGTISGRVLDPDGHPASRARVELSLADGDPEEKTLIRLIADLKAETDAWGRYSITGIPGHSGYLLIAAHRVHVTGVLQGVSVKAGERIEGVDLKLVRGGTIRGRVLDERGAGIPGIPVEANWHRGRKDEATQRRLRSKSSTWRATTDARGGYEIRSLIPGTYAVGARVEGRVSPEASLVEISGLETRDSVDLQFALGEVLRGRLLASDGSPLCRWWVVLEDRNGETYTDTQGRFEIRGLKAGKIKALAARMKFVSGSYWVEAWFEASLPGGETVIVLPRKAKIAGRVLVPPGPSRLIEVSAKPLAAAPAVPLTDTTAGIDAEGRFLLEVYPGRYRLQANIGDFFVVGETYLPTVPIEVEVAEGEAREGVELVFDDAGAIRGTVRRWGEPAARARLRAASLRGPGGAEAEADEAGSFEFPRLPPGDYLLSAWTISPGKGVGGRRQVTVDLVATPSRPSFPREAGNSCSTSTLGELGGTPHTKSTGKPARRASPVAPGRESCALLLCAVPDRGCHRRRSEGPCRCS